MRIMQISTIAILSASETKSELLRPPELLPMVAPKGVTPPVMALDQPAYQIVTSTQGFPGYQYLAMLATRAEYRAMAERLSSELTREWIKVRSSGDIDNAEKVDKIEQEFRRLNVREIIRQVSEHDCYFGRGQIFIEIRGADRATPLILHPKTVPQGSLQRVVAVEPMWVTPSSYNALDPSAPDFYRPTDWYMLGQHVHASRLVTIITRPLPDMLKPAFNFSGMSLSQLAEPYVNNWLRTRQSVADLINNFSVLSLKTDLSQLLNGGPGDDVLSRAEHFTRTRSNKGLMILDKDREELDSLAVPLGGLHELQAQAQEHMCAVSQMPAVILTGITPTGLNASSEGEIRVFYDWIAARQEAFFREPLEILLKVVQLSLFGEIDPTIGIEFCPLYQMSEKEKAEIRAMDTTSDANLMAAGVISPGEVRERLAREQEGIYQGLDVDEADPIE